MDFVGLPLHPLVVHLVVVALPVGALATVAAVVSPAVRERFGVLAIGTLTLGALGAIAAKFSGEALAETVLRPESHERFGNATLIVGLATAALAWLWWWLERRREQAPPGTSGFGAMATGGLLATAALAVTVLAVLTGHSGAQATWSSRLATPDAAATGQAAPTASWSLEEVAQHDSAEDCWAAVGDGVYDLTSWVTLHPGGRQRILELCGTDATGRFMLQHERNPRSNAQLEALRIGGLA
ncbi:MAG TPA: cytochrome b5 domain-containing protein [Propionibacterium sp.]|nr:cytochrome b5 domain-containing protein [Propionibacterium sp.]